MMPVIRINDGTFSDLKALSAWLGTKTPGDTIDKIVQSALEEYGIERDAEAKTAKAINDDGTMEFDAAPGLAFTKPLSATIGDKKDPNPRWATILLEVITQVKAKGVEGKSLAKELNIPTKLDRYDDQGFTFHSELGISIQGQSAADSWKEVDRLAKKWHIPVVVEFCWRQNPKAQHPGRTGLLRSGS